MPDPGSLTGQSHPYVSHDDLRARVHEAVGFLDGLAAGLLFWGASDRNTVADAIFAEAERLRRDAGLEPPEVPDAG